MKMRKLALVLTAAIIATSSASFAGGLADAIVEREPVAVAPAQANTANALPGWVLPAAALLLLGAVAANGSGDGGGGDSGGDGTPPVSAIDPK
ncbi:hypothetical protein [Yoonia sp. 2307UL14-13]|uniref:hypothetical protein n=1 Tax=Yoonia sp. 2307UL14-13 TaxID=3126506 RepID=UPI0030A18240